MRNVSKTTVPVAVVALIIGLAFGIAAFPRTTTLTATQTVTSATTHLIIQNETVISSGTESYTVVTFTQVGVQTYYDFVTCTTLSGGATTTYAEQFGGPTSVTTLYPGSLPPEFIVTIVTATYFSEPVTTEYQTASC